METDEAKPATRPMMFLTRWLDPSVAIAFGCIIVLLLLGSLYSRSFLSPEYLLQQLKVASFLGVIATGMMLVILLGQIDLSVPWVVALGGMMSSAIAGFGPVGHALAIPFGIGCGVAIGLLNGIGVAYLRIPSMIITLAMNAVVQGLMVVHTGGFSPQDSASAAMRFLATGFIIPNLPNAVLVWAVIGALTIFALNRTTFGRADLCHRQQRARRLSVGCADPARGHGDLRDLGWAQRLCRRAACRLCQQGGAGHGRSLSPAGHRGGGARRHLHSRRARHLSRHGRRRHLDHLAAVDPVGHADGEAGRQIIYGVVIIAMMLLYGRERLKR